MNLKGIGNVEQKVDSIFIILLNWKVTCRAGRYLSILVIPWYGNQAVCVSSKIQ